MPAYVIAEVEVHEPAPYEGYKRMVPTSLEAYGGRFVARGGSAEALEGERPRGRLVILEFPSYERARAWHASEEYREAKALRRRLSTSRVLLVDGV